MIEKSHEAALKIGINILNDLLRAYEEGKINREEAIRMDIDVLEGVKRACSMGGSTLWHKDGLEKQWNEASSTLDTMREIAQAMEHGNAEEQPARRALRPWQQEIMENGIQERMIIA